MIKETSEKVAVIGYLGLGLTCQTLAYAESANCRLNCWPTELIFNFN